MVHLSAVVRRRRAARGAENKAWRRLRKAGEGGFAYAAHPHIPAERHSRGARAYGSMPGMRDVGIGAGFSRE
jgi:hypothetical protein